MKFSNLGSWASALLVCALAIPASAEDIDIFSGTTEVDAEGLPNVLFVLDNTSNWSREAQKWPDGTQGQSEARAIKTVLANQIGKINVGLMMYATQSNDANNDGGYVRIDVQPLTEDYYNNVVVPAMDAIIANVEDPTEKRSASNTYGYLPYDVYNYLKGDDQSKGGAGTPTTLSDEDGYTSQWDEFESPLQSEAVCADTYMIYIGNNKNGSIAGDDTTNSNALKAAYVEAGKTAPDALAGDISGTPLEMPEFSCDVEGDPGVELGTSTGCYFNALACETAVNTSLGESICDDTLADGETCFCTETTGSFCANDGGDKSFHYLVESSGTETTVCEATSGFDYVGGRDYNLDDWTQFLFNEGVPFTAVADLDGDGVDETYPERVKVISYMIDVFNEQQSPDLSELWFSAASAGGGKYFQAKDENALVFALEISLGDIVAKASSFAAVTLPLSTTNRAQVNNEVYIGMFRPEQGKDPRWYGNLKRYQFALFNGQPRLADVQYREAVNNLTGFPSDCAISFWTEDSVDYWESLGIDPTVASECSSLDPNEVYSDSPDGPFVEKGGAGQQIRQLTYGSERTIYTPDPSDLTDGLSPLVDMDPNTIFGADVYSYLIGDQAGTGEAAYAGGTLQRPSVHGDVVHSRPLSIRYDDGSVVIYYGENGGMYHAVDTSTGVEKWAFIAPEHYAKIQRLYDDEPKIKYTGELVDPNEPDTEPKDYFFDGPTGLHVEYDDPNDPASEALGDLQFAYIYPTMRRGGRMLYGFDVTDPNNPEMLWKQGCDDDGVCTDNTDFGNLGQTWSTPRGIFLSDYPGGGLDPNPLVLFGGGYDECLDEDASTYPSACSGANGKGVYLLDAVSGALVDYFPTDAPVLTDVATVDLDLDEVVELAYVADAAGSIYRIRFADYQQSLAGLETIPDGAIVHRAQADWEIEKIASVPGNTLRFYNSPTAATTTTLGQIAITIGSGDRERPLESNYPYVDNVQNRFYVLFDYPYTDWAAEQEAIDGGGLWTRTVVDLEDPNDMFEVGTALQPGEDLRDFEGWWMDLPNQGEQVANPAAVGAGKVFFNTFQPGGASVGLCTSPIGIGRAYSVDLFAPQTAEGVEIAGGGIPIPPIIETVADIPPGCEEEDCSDYEPDCSAPGACPDLTLCMGGCEDGLNPTVLDPLVDPQIQRVFFTEEIDAESN